MSRCTVLCNTLEPQEIDLLVLVVCYRAADLTIDCLRSLECQIVEVPRSKVAICENGSSDDSLRTLRETIDQHGWADWVMLKAIEPNQGFTGGNNAILREVMSWPNPPHLVLLLNADTIVRPGALRELFDAAEAHPEAGVISPRLEWPNGNPQISCFRDRGPINEFLTAARTGLISSLLRVRDGGMPISDQPFECEWTSFACALLRREVLLQTGLLDEGFYLYFDDPDYCRRARRDGWRVLHWPTARVVHLRGRSNPTKQLVAELKRRPRYWYISRSRYFAKYYGRLGLWSANVLWWCGRCISLARELVGNKEPHTCQREWLDIWINAIHPMKVIEVKQS
jgi:GT2 family glycosyltransferase